MRGSYAFVLFLLLVCAGTAFAAPATQSVADVIDVNGNVLGSSKLVRTDNGLSVNLSTSGLVPGDAYTIWWIIFKTDGMGGLQFGVVTNASGNQADVHGDMTVAGHFSTGPLPPVDGTTTIFSTGGTFDDPKGATVQIIVRTHGPVIPGLQSEQFGTINGACPPNSCFDVQISQHSP